ncbi:GDP-mannose mannosyl hydrolase [Azoarcus sp. PA01]|nr:GDP-mannose mannosyl hydrolase [Azoarcus sp. PA01]
MWLSGETFRIVVASTPLVSIDLVVENTAGEILLGERRNRPAQGCWFVPGGRVLKNETLDAAFRRLTQAELGQVFERGEANFLGVFEHFYRDSVFGEAGPADPHGAPDTHYVVLAYRLGVADSVVLNPPEAQHGRYRWWRPADMRASAVVHGNTRAYVMDTPGR